VFSVPLKKKNLADEDRPAPDRPGLVVVSSTEHRSGMRSGFFKETKAVLATIADQPGLLGHAVRFEIFGNKRGR